MNFRQFQTPDTRYRPAPFWAINDRITPEETARQMSDMLSVGLSGGFFHSRSGLITDYLGNDWFKAMDAALRVAREQDGYLWLYDEDLWPSGNAGGRVAALKDDYRAARLQAVLLAPGETLTLPDESEFKAAYLLQRDGMTLTSATKISDEEQAERSDVERLVFYRVYDAKIGWWSGESYANLLNPEAMEQFVTFTHEVYASKYSDEFGKRIPGIFTDEPQLSCTADALPWYEGIPTRYHEWMGRDFWADLPYLFFDGGEYRKIRLLLHRTILRQFCEAFSKPIYQWCEEHGLAHTGHFMNEDSLDVQIRSHSGSVMAHYRYQQIPGIDHLCRQTEPLLLCVKQASSAARQLGRKQVLTEIFGVSRHTNTFQDFKWIGDYDLVLGANLFCPHLSLYSAKGRRKRDYPPNWNYQQTYWHELRPLNDYFARMGAMLTTGEAKADVLVLHPIESATAARRFAVKSSQAMPGEDMSAAHHADTHLRRTLEAILNAGFECDLGDEWFMEDYGAVEGDHFRIGEMAYQVVVVPPSQTWRPTTVALLQQFAANGGKLIFVGDLPKEIDADPAADIWRELAAQGAVVPSATRQIQEAIDRLAPSGFRLRATDGRPASKTYLQHRVDGEQQIFFIVNSDRDHAQEYHFTLQDAVGTPLAIWNPLDGTRTAVTPQMVGHDLRYRFTLPPVGSLLLIAGAGAVEDALPEPPVVDLRAANVITLPHTWQFTRSEENVLVMDRLRASIDGGKSWLADDLDFRVRKQLATHFNVGDSLWWQPWVSIRKGLFDGKGGDVLLQYRFQSAIEHPHAYLVLEDLRKGQLTINGHPIDVAQAGWQWDHDFGKVEIGELIRRGENVVEFRVDYTFLTEVEPGYIVGDFGVRVTDPYSAEIIAESTSISNGSWLDQGYPFYSGTMRYRTTIPMVPAGKRAFIQLNRASGTLFSVRVNGTDAGDILWQPHVLEITDLLHPGDNTLEIAVVSSRQNTLGPLHEREGDNFMWCGPNAFENEWDVREEWSLFDYGLLDGAELLVTD